MGGRKGEKSRENEEEREKGRGWAGREREGQEEKRGGERGREGKEEAKRDFSKFVGIKCKKVKFVFKSVHILDMSQKQKY